MVSYKRFFLTDKSISQVQALLRPIPRQQIYFKCFSVIHIIADIIYTTSKHFWKSGNGSKIHLKSHVYHADVSRSLCRLYNSVMEQQNTLKRTTDTLKIRMQRNNYLLECPFALEAGYKRATGLCFLFKLCKCTSRYIREHREFKNTLKSIYI